MKKIILIACLSLLAASCSKRGAVIKTQIPPEYKYISTLQIGNKTLTVEIAQTPSAMAQGLSDRMSMADNQGMLFDFGNGTSVDPAFWMKDMDFNLDFIWIDQSSSTDSTSSPQAVSEQVVGVTPNVPKPVNCQSSIVNCTASLPYYYPPSPVNWVLEVNAGWAEKNNIAIGDEVKLIDKIDHD